MEWTLPVYLARPRPTRWAASLPWFEPLAEPVRDTRPSRAAEAVLLRAVEHVWTADGVDDLDALLPPEDLERRDLTLEIEHAVDPNRPPVVLSAETHVLVGRLRGSDLLRVWLPAVPGTCLAVENHDDVERAVHYWADEWLERTGASSLDALDADHPSRFTSFELDLPLAELHRDDSRPTGRWRRPEALRSIATHETHRLAERDSPVAFGRDALVEELVEAIASGDTTCICLIGPSSTGKTALLEEATRRARERQPLYQTRRDVWRTSADQLEAAAERDDTSIRRATRALDELAERGDVLTLDALAPCLQAGDARGEAFGDLLVPRLDDGELSLLAEATADGFERILTRWPAFGAVCRRLRVPPLDRREALEVAHGFVRSVETRAAVDVTPDGFEAALDIADRYIRHEDSPGDVLRLLRRCLDEAERLESDDTESEESTGDPRTRIDAETVARVFHRRTGLPLRLIESERGRRADTIRDAFEQRVFDQPAASRAVVDLVATVEQDLVDPERPYGNFLLIGPSGVGKTETAKTLADQLFGSERRLVRFDMSEFAGPEAASRFVGTPEHPEGELVDRVRAQPFCVLLFDEIEKAHRKARDALLQVMEEGRMTDAAGRTVDLCNAVVAMTSNLGDESERVETDLDRATYDRRAVEEAFRPEFVHRLDRIVSYRPLETPTLRRIARRTLRDLLARRGLHRLRVMVDVDEALIAQLVEGTRDRRYGARTLARRVERALTAPLARALARRRSDGDVTRVTVEPAPDGELDLRLRTLPVAPAGERPPGVRDLDAELHRLVEGGEAPEPPIPEGTEPDPEDVRRRFRALIGVARALEATEALSAIERDYEGALDDINARAADDAPVPHALGERLRQLEIARQGVETLLDALEDRCMPADDEDDHGGFAMGEGVGVDEPLGSSPEAREPETTGDRLELDLPDFAAMRREQLHEWADDYEQFWRDWVWLTRQIDALLDTDIDESTLVIRGLSGPYHPVLGVWYRALRDFARSREIELAAVGSIDGEWRRCEGDELPEGVSTLVLSAEHPGMGDAFEALAGYTWAPQPPEQGRHALVLTETAPRGTGDAETLFEMLHEGDLDGETTAEDDVSPTDPSGLRESSDREGDAPADEPCVEFVLEEGRLRDLRRDWARTLPGRTGEPMQRFANAWMLERLVI